MILDFNFDLKDNKGQVRGNAGETISDILDNGSQTDERYLDKTDKWSKLLAKGGKIDLDETDMKVLKKMVLDARFVVNVAKHQLKEFIQKRIDESKAGD